MNKVIILTIISVFVVVSFAIAKEQEDSWEGIGKWLEWKVHTNLPQKQREVVDYFKKSGDIIKKAENIWSEGPRTIHPKPSPVEGLRLIDECIAEYKALKPPEICKKHCEASLAYLDVAREYQEAKKKTEDVNELGKVSEKSVTYGDIMASENWRVLNKIGLFDNIEEESINLGLVDKKKLDKEYRFFKKYPRGEIIKCPACDGVMKRVKILYEGDNDYENAIKNQSNNFLFGNKKFVDCPEFGYICGKCPKWYEEYPGPTADIIIIRNWGWGWHELVYK